MTVTKGISSSLLLIVLAGCTTEPVGVQYPDFGNAVRQNVAAETINPMAPNDKSALQAEAERAALAQRRYVTGTTKPATITSTVAGVGGGGGGGTGGTGAGVGAGPVQ